MDILPCIEVLAFFFKGKKPQKHNKTIKSPIIYHRKILRNMWNTDGNDCTQGCKSQTNRQDIKTGIIQKKDPTLIDVL